MAYLDSSNVEDLVSDIKALADQTYPAKTDLPAIGLYYGVCSTAGATAAKEVTISGITSLFAGLTIAVKFANYNTASNPTLNVNNLGAKSLYRYGTTPITNNAAYGGWNENSILILTYDGNAWIETYWHNSAIYTTAICHSDGTTIAKTASCDAFSLENTDPHWVYISFTSSNTYAGKITLNINGTGAKDVYINGTISSASNYSLPAGSYLAYYDGEKYQFRTDGKLPGMTQGNAPYEHASTNTAHGKGTSSYYGHVKLSSAVNSSSGESDGVAATPEAIKTLADNMSVAVQTLLGSSYATNVGGGGNVSLSADPLQYAFLYVIFGTASTLSHSTRGGVLVSMFSASSDEHYPVAIGGTVGYVKLAFTNTGGSYKLAIASSSYTNLYVHRVYGARKK